MMSRIQRFLSLGLLTALTAAMLSGCTSSDSKEPTPSATASPGSEATSAASPTATNSPDASPGSNAGDGSTHDDPADYKWDESSVVEISLRGDTATSGSNAVKVDGSTVTVTRAGTYRLSGTLSDGQVVVETADAGTVRLLLKGVTITNTDQAAIAVNDAKKVVLILADGSRNSLTDGEKYAFADAATDEPNAALFSTADLTIAGNGSLAVSGKYNDGITSKDGLIIAGGTISVNAADDGIRGKDYVVLKGGTVTLIAGGDGIKADNDEDAALGFVSVLGGTASITVVGDGIDAESAVTVSDGKLTLVTGGGAGATVAADASAKAIKGTGSVSITGGTFAINAADDAVHSNNAVTIGGGSFTIATGDDAIHGDKVVTIDGGSINVTRSYEGIESIAITINAGDITVVCSDDCINAADGTGGGPPGGPGARPGAGGGSNTLAVNGGTILVNSGGDGLDINGSITMTGGTVVIQGPTANNNSAIDYDGSFTMTGGFIVAVGSAGMAQSIGPNSTVKAIALRVAQQAESLIHIESPDGEEIVTLRSIKPYQSLVVASPKLQSGVTYQVFTGGSAAGTNQMGLYPAGVYSGGTLLTTATVSTGVQGR